MGLTPEVRVYSIDETPHDGEAPESYVRRMAAEKLQAALVEERGHVLSADTVVVDGGRVLGKPRDAAHNTEMLEALSGQVHQVITAVAVGTRAKVEVRAVVSEVRFRRLSAATIARYVATQEGFDKAGGYGIQGIAGGFVSEILGSYSAIVGLPLCESVAMLESAGAIGDWP